MATKQTPRNHLRHTHAVLTRALTNVVALEGAAARTVESLVRNAVAILAAELEVKQEKQDVPREG